jgi:CO dehydrogenase/acetyl-CoA synthase alpha subunit
MFRSFRTLATALVAALALTTTMSAAPAQSTTSKSSTKSASHASHAQSLVGTLQKFDESGKTLTVQTSKGSETLPLAPNAKINAGSKTLSASDLATHTGAKVKVRYTESNGQKMAESVTLADSSSSKSMAKASKK